MKLWRQLFHSQFSFPAIHSPSNPGRLNHLPKELFKASALLGAHPHAMPDDSPKLWRQIVHSHLLYLVARRSDQAQIFLVETIRSWKTIATTFS
jgi:hypothetical protein